MTHGAPIVSPLIARAVTDSDADQIQAMFESDPGYFELTQGAPPGPAEVQSLVTALPPDGDRGYEDKFLFILLDGDDVVGVVDLIRNYPTPSTWYLGLIFLVPTQRGKGLGRAVLRGLYTWIAAQGGTALRLGVVEGNERARWLYASEGFVFQTAREPDPTVRRVRRVLVLERPICA
jgi:GNAT superfamily N-acetyltransferase